MLRIFDTTQIRHLNRPFAKVIPPLHNKGRRRFRFLSRFEGLAAESDRRLRHELRWSLKHLTLPSPLALPGSPAVRFRTPPFDFGQKLG
jgi:hypothetical protein